MNPEIEKLIDLALADGEITDKERSVILKKAEKLGEDLDEVDMIIESKVHKSQPRKKKVEDLNLCPSCGEVISGLSKTCICGYVINSNDFKNSRSLEESVETLENLIVKIRTYGRGSSKSELEGLISQIEKEVRYVNTRYGGNSDIQKLIKNLEEFSETHISKILNYKKRKTLFFRGLYSILLIISGVFIYYKITHETTEEKFKREVTEKYQNSINAFKETKSFQKDSIRFSNIYDFTLSNTITRQKNNDSLMKALSDFDVNNPTPFRFYVLSVLSKDNGDYVNAKKYIDSCLVLFPNFAPIYLSKSRLVNIEFEEKLSYLEKSIELDNNKKRYLFNRALIYTENKDYKKALNYIRTYNQFYKNNYNSHSYEMTILFLMNMNSFACEKFNSLKRDFNNEYQKEPESIKKLIEQTCKL